jgi:1,4-alpha-glucan branching enzyme
MQMQMTTQLFDRKSLTNANRMTPFAFQTPTARQVSLAGDFDNWDPKARLMHKAP